MIDITAEAGLADSPPVDQTLPGEPILRPEARVVRADRSLAAMVLVICTLGGMGVGFGFAMYLMRAQLAYSPFSEARYSAMPTATPPLPLLGAFYDPDRHGPGARITRIMHGTGAERAGLVANDVIMAVDGEAIREANDLVPAVVRTHDPGDVIPIELVRNGRPLLIHARLGFR